jgi:hypothetical protein
MRRGRIGHQRNAAKALDMSAQRRGRLAAIKEHRRDRCEPGQSGLYLNLAPASAASYIKPPLMIEKEAMPFS